MRIPVCQVPGRVTHFTITCLAISQDGRNYCLFEHWRILILVMCRQISIPVNLELHSKARGPFNYSLFLILENVQFSDDKISTPRRCSPIHKFCCIFVDCLPFFCLDRGTSKWQWKKIKCPEAKLGKCGTFFYFLDVLSWKSNKMESWQDRKKIFFL